MPLRAAHEVAIVQLAIEARKLLAATVPHLGPMRSRICKAASRVWTSRAPGSGIDS